MFRSRFLWKTVVVCSLLSPFVLLSTSLKPSGQNNVIGRLAKEFVFPVESAWHQTLLFFGDLWTRYVDLVDVAKENQALNYQLFRLKTKLLDYEEKAKEIERLRRILGFKQRRAVEHEVAEVIGTPKDIPFEIVRISKGKLNGIQIGMPVITGEGALGRVIRTGFYHSDIQLLTDAYFHLDVLLQRTRARGVLRGDFGQSCSLKLNRRAEVRIGDTLITSGIVGGFPKGIPVGRVVRISYESDNITQIISVEPWVIPRQVEEVLVLKTRDAEIEKIISASGEEWLEHPTKRSSRRDAG